MQTVYCNLCERKVGAKRAFGWGTFFAVVLTSGLWLLALPFYPIRCTVCGSDNLSEPGLKVDVPKPQKEHKYLPALLTIGAFILVLALVGGQP